MKIWRRLFGPRDADRPDVEGTRRSLAATKAETSRVRAETQKYAQLGHDLRSIRQDNHLAAAFLTAATRRGNDG